MWRTLTISGIEKTCHEGIGGQGTGVLETHDVLAVSEKVRKRKRNDGRNDAIEKRKKREGEKEVGKEGFLG